MRRSTITLVIIFLILGGFAWYMQQPDNPIKLSMLTPTVTPSIGTNTLILPVYGPINQLTVQNSDGKTITLDKTISGWVINTDKKISVDQNMAESAAAQCLNLQIIKRLEKAPELFGTGLDKPTYKVSCKQADGSLISFKVGKETATGSGYYVELSSGIIYILGKSELDTLIQNLAVPPIQISNQTPNPENGTSNPARGGTTTQTP